MPPALTETLSSDLASSISLLIRRRRPGWRRRPACRWWARRPEAARACGWLPVVGRAGVPDSTGRAARGTPAGRGPRARPRPRAPGRRRRRRSRPPGGAGSSAGVLGWGRPRSSRQRAASTCASRSRGGRCSSRGPPARRRSPGRGRARSCRSRAPRPARAAGRASRGRRRAGRRGARRPSCRGPSTVSPVSTAPLGGQHERQRVGGVAGRRDDVHLEPVDLDDVAVAEPLASRAGTPGRARVRRSPSARRTPARPRSGRGGGGSAAPTPTSPASSRDRVEVRLVGRARVDHDRPRRARARAAPRCWCRRASSCSAFGASTQRPRSPKDPPVQVAHRLSRALQQRPQPVGHRQRAAVVRRLDLGREHLDDAASAAAPAPRRGRRAGRPRGR